MICILVICVFLGYLGCGVLGFSRLIRYFWSFRWGVYFDRVDLEIDGLGVYANIVGDDI